MNITVLGANGKTGLEVVKQALENGHSVNAVVRHAEAMPTQPSLNIIVGDVTNAQDVAKASKDASVIISTLGAMSGSLMTNAVTAVIMPVRQLA
jgi:putative NADH-flavin reductase